MHVGLSPPVSFVCLFSPQGKRLPAYLSADAEEGEVSDDDSADEIEDDFKLKSSNVRKESLSFPVLKIKSNLEIFLQLLSVPIWAAVSFWVHVHLSVKCYLICSF